MDPAQLIALAQKTLTQAKENKSYQMSVNQLKLKLSSIPETPESILCLALISLIEEDYELTKAIKKIESIKEIKSEVAGTIEKMVYMLQIEPYPNIYPHLNSIEFTSELFKLIKESYYHIYLIKQALYLSKFYSKIKIKTLEKYLGKELTPEYLGRFNWVKKDDYVVTAPIEEPFNVLRLMKDLEFIGKMNIAFERITQGNILV